MSIGKPVLDESDHVIQIEAPTVVVKVVVASTQSLDFYLIMAAALLRGLRDPGGVGVVERVPNGRSATSHSAQSSCAAGRVKVVRPRSFLAAGAPP